MAKDRYTEERDKQEEAKKLRGKKANEVIADPTIEDPVEPIVEEIKMSPAIDFDYINEISVSG